MYIQQSFRKDDTNRGILYVTATPIGNLGDMTERAIETLRQADWIAAEDTRHTLKLLNHFGIEGKLVSYHEHNKTASGGQLLRKLMAGESVALVSDAGLPAISDPGRELVRQAVDHEIAVVPIPGANAALSALIVSGLPTDQFWFEGFLPKEKRKLKERIEVLAAMPGTLIVYEAPHRLKTTVKAMLDGWGNRQAAMVRELTKAYEEIARGTLEECVELLEHKPPRGEYCLVVEGASNAPADTRHDRSALWWSMMSVEEHVEVYIGRGDDRRTAMKKAAADRGVSKRDIYDKLLT